MITEEEFKKQVVEVLENGVVEGYAISNVGIIFKYINDCDLLSYFFDDFKTHYDSSNIEPDLLQTKINDFVYRLDFFVDVIDEHLNQVTFNKIKSIIIVGRFDFYSAVNYRREDDVEIYFDYMETFMELGQKTYKELSIGI